MWIDIKRKIQTLADFDKTRQVFGARSHNFRFGNPLSERDATAWERSKGFQLPKELRSYFTQCGNGGAGPYFGMKPLNKMDLFKPDRPFLDAAHLKAVAKSRDDPDDEDCDYYYENDAEWDVPNHAYQGLVSIIEFGCGEKICCVVNGPQAGQLVKKNSGNGLREMGSLRGEFDRWLSEEISRFEYVRTLLDTCASAQDLSDRCVEKHEFYNGRDYMVSYLGIPKPPELFGEAENRYHGAVQFPWYEKQFPKKKKRFWVF